MPLPLPDFARSFSAHAPASAASPPFHAGARVVADAALLARDHGSDAALAAALRAAQNRARDNIVGYCHWREVERLIGWIDGAAPGHTRH